MQKLMTCVWVDFFLEGSQDTNAKQLQTLIRNFVTNETDGEIQTLDQGVWVFLPTVSQAMDFALALLENLQVQAKFRILITVGDLVKEGERWSGWVLDRVGSLIKQLEVGQIWFTESMFYMANLENIAWEEIGIISADVEHRCYRLLTQEQCFTHPILKRAASEQKVVVFHKDGETPVIRKGKHAVFVGYEYDGDLHAEVARVQTIVGNDHLWLVVPHLKASHRQQWSDLGRHLIVANPDVFMEDIGRDDLTLMSADANATMFLDPISLASGEISLVGIALPKVPMARIIDGYSIDLLESGEWGYAAQGAMLRVHVTLETETMTALREGCRLNSQEMEVGKPYPMGNGARFTVNRLTYRYIANVGKPYQGIVLGEPTKRVAVTIGERVEMGRQPAGGGFVLQDRGGADEIVWANTSQAQTAAQNQLTLDRALTGRHHVAVSILSAGKFCITSMHDKLPTFMLAENSQILQRIMGEKILRDEGLLVVGTNLIKVTKS